MEYLADLNDDVSNGKILDFIDVSELKFNDEIRNELTSRLSLEEGDTLFIISADHGHKNIDKVYTLLDYPEIQECMIMPASLESRVLSFWIKEDMKAKFVECFNKEFKDEFKSIKNTDKHLYNCLNNEPLYVASKLVFIPSLKVKIINKLYRWFGKKRGWCN